jgi:hypothetical protein
MPLLRPRAVGAPLDNEIAPIAAAPEGPLREILKWLPVEIIGFYQAVTAAVPTDSWCARLWVTAAGIVVCFLWIAFATKPNDKGFAWRQIILSTLAFTFWGVAVQSEVIKHYCNQWQLWIGTVVLIFGTVLLPIFEGILTKLGVPQNT